MATPFVGINRNLGSVRRQFDLRKRSYRCQDWNSVSVSFLSSSSSSSSCSSPPHSDWSHSTSSSGSTIVDVTPLAEQLRASVRAYIQSYSTQQQQQVPPNQPPILHQPIRLVGILAEMGPYRQDAELYSQRIEETCIEDGISYELIRCHGTKSNEVLSVSSSSSSFSSSSSIQTTIQQINQRSDVHGILIFYPIFHNHHNQHQHQHHHHHPHHHHQQQQQLRGPYKNRLTGVYYKTQDDYLRDLVDPMKDVEGLSGDYNRRCRFRYHQPNQESTTNSNNNNNHVILPCTALSVKTILDHYTTNDWNGRIVSIMNRSEIVGRPLAAMLAACGAMVYSINVDSILQFKPGGRLRRCTDPSTTLESCLRQSSVVVSGVPDPNFILPSSAIADGTTVVNVSEFTNVDEVSLLERPNIKYIPHVGKVTVAVLEQNLIRLHQKAAQTKATARNEETGTA